MRNLLTSCLVLVYSVCLSGPSAWATPTLDQESISGQVGAVLAGAGGSIREIQQGVTAGLAGQLVKIELYCSAGVGSTTLFINRGSPWETDADDFTTTISATAQGWFSVDLTSAGLCFERRDPFVIGFLPTGTDAWYLVVTIGGYAAGEMWQQIGSNPPGPKGNADLAFRTYVDEDVRSLTVRSGTGGSVISPGEGMFIYGIGETVGIEAVPSDPNHEFKMWTGTAVESGKVEDPNAAHTKLLVDRNYTLQAVFAERSTPAFGFSIGEIGMDDQKQFESRISTNNITGVKFVERMHCQMPDPNGFMQMNVINGQSAQAKVRFGKNSADRVLIRFDYLFESEDVEIVAYLSDTNDVGDRDPVHVKEVARLLPPSEGRPGSVGSGRYAEFERWVSTAGLNLARGTYVELELVKQAQVQGQVLRVYGLGTATSYAATAGGGGVVIVDNLVVGVCSGVCMDLTWDNGVDAEDFSVLASALGRSIGTVGSQCLNGIFGQDGFLDSLDLGALDCMASCTSCGNLCGEMPLAGNSGPAGLPEVKTSLGVSVAVQSGLLILGKRPQGASLQDNMYNLQADWTFTGRYSPTGFGDQWNVRLVGSDTGQVYGVNSRTGVVDLGGNGVVSGGVKSGVLEPRYGELADVYVGIQGQGDRAFGRPILDAVVQGDEVYVIPVVVAPASKPAYLAAARFSLSNGSLQTIYDDPNKNITCPRNPGDPNLMGLREIEVDGQGSVYVLNVHHLRGSTLLWKYSSQGEFIGRIELDKQGVIDPVGLCVSRAGDRIYMASGQYDPRDPNTAKVYRFSTANLTLQGTILIQGLYHVTGIAEHGGSLWVVGFNLDWIPDTLVLGKTPCYRSCIARVAPDGQAEVRSLATSANADLALPMSIVWTGN